MTSEWSRVLASTSPEMIPTCVSEIMENAFSLYTSAEGLVKSNRCGQAIAFATLAREEVVKAMALADRDPCFDPISHSHKQRALRAFTFGRYPVVDIFRILERRLGQINIDNESLVKLAWKESILEYINRISTDETLRRKYWVRQAVTSISSRAKNMGLYVDVRPKGRLWIPRRFDEQTVNAFLFVAREDLASTDRLYNNSLLFRKHSLSFPSVV